MTKELRKMAVFPIFWCTEYGANLKGDAFDKCRLNEKKCLQAGLGENDKRIAENGCFSHLLVYRVSRQKRTI